MPPLKRSADIDRRLALKLMAGAAALTMTRCSPPDEQIVPYVEMPEGLVAGEPMRFATTLTLGGYGRGFLGVSVDGRPIKIEGNPRHPYSLGATDIFAEGSVLALYDPGRSAAPRRQGQIATWDDFDAEWEHAAAAASGAIGLVTGRITSPTTLGRVAALKARFPELRWYRYEPVNDDMARAGTRLAFGKALVAQPRWDEADIVLALAADPLGHGPAQLRLARQFSARRDPRRRQRLHVVEPGWTLTGAMADFRLALAPQSIPEIARLIAAKLGAAIGEPKLGDAERAFAERAAAELTAAPGHALAAAGETQPAELHALAHWINARLKAPVDWVPSSDPVEADHARQLSALAEDLRAKRIAALVVIDANPVYDAPDALGLGELIRAAAFSAHLGLYNDETAQACRWHLPRSHPLESWGDARAVDGTASLLQPLIKPLYDTRTADEFLAALASEPAKAGYELTRATWRDTATGDFENWWRTALHDGVIPDSAAKAVAVPEPRLPELQPFAEQPGLTLVRLPHHSLWDGRFANNAWLQECPSPFSKQVWGNGVELAPGDAARLGIADEDTVEIAFGGASLRAPAVVLAGQPEGVVRASLGQGHRGPDNLIGTGIGERFGGLGDQPFATVLAGVTLRRATADIPFRSTQAHTRLRGRAEELFQLATPAQIGQRRPAAEVPPPSLLNIPGHGDYAWAMVIDTDRCIGCNACVIACQAENNVPVVGPAEISQGRDMHWLRVDAYARTQGEVLRRGFQPVPCMHCELAPCEPVCPVEASVHDHQGLNVQVYNRCIGTRFCEANCPYKVRRFNWFAYAAEQAYGGLAPALKAVHNPDVSARGRGVMEKCNYCLQRIVRARRAAEREDRVVAEGEMVTACQAACPTRAIHFGDLNRADSDVSKQRQSPAHYVLLEELNTRPRTTYLKRLYADDGAPS